MDDQGARMLAAWNERMEKETRIPLWETGKVPDYNPAYGQREPSLVAFLPKADSSTTGEGLRGAMRVLRHSASQWHIDPDKIGILGFSAGGQITVSVATLFDDGDATASDPVERVSCRPDVQVPCYPAISLVGRDKDKQQASPEERVSTGSGTDT